MKEGMDNKRLGDSGGLREKEEDRWRNDDNYG